MTGPRKGVAPRLTQATALGQAQKIFGKHAAIRDDKTKSSPELRAAAAEQRERMLPIEPADRKSLEWKGWSVAVSVVRHDSTYYRFAVGKVVMGLFFSIEGEGDTWAEAFADYQSKRRAA